MDRGLKGIKIVPELVVFRVSILILMDRGLKGNMKNLRKKFWDEFQSLFLWTEDLKRLLL